MLQLKNPAPGDIGWLISNHGTTYAKEFGFDTQFEFDIAVKVVSFLQKKNPFNSIFIGTVNGMNAGSIAVSALNDSTAFINFLLVSESFRSVGLAKMLLNACIEHCKNNGISCIQLETYSCLTDARALYKKTGFQQIEVNRGISKYNKTFDQEYWELKI